jgi:hypothetical protein
MLRIAALGLSALFALGCAAEPVGLTEQDLDDIRPAIRKHYAAKDLQDCRDSGTYIYDYCAEIPFALKDLFLEIRDGEASGFIKYLPRQDRSIEVVLWCSVTVYDNGEYAWKCGEL